MRAILLLGLLGLGACGNIEQIAAASFQGAMPRWQDASPNPRPVTAQYTQIQPAPISAETIALQRQEKLREQENARAQAAYDTWAQNPHRGHTNSLGILDVAVVCTTEDDVELVMQLIYQYKGDVMTDAIMHGQFRIYHGVPAAPDPAAFGCSTVPARTTVLVKYVQGLPVISVRTKEGLVQGVTHPASVSLDEAPPQ